MSRGSAPAPAQHGPGGKATANGVRTPAGRAVVRAALWNYAGSVVAALLQLGYAAYTGRTVSAAAFGAFASALSLTQLLGYFANAGLATTVLRTGDRVRDVVEASLRLGVLSGLACCAFMQATAPMWAGLWNAPEAAAMLRVLGCQFLFLPVAAVAMAGLRRLLAQRAAVLVETAAQACGLLAGTLLLALGYNPLALAAAPVATHVCMACTAGVALARRLRGVPRRPRAGDRGRLCGRAAESAGSVAGASGFLAGHQLTQFVTNTAPLWVAGAVLGSAAAGSFSRATLFLGLPLTMLAAGLTRVTTPALSDLRARPAPPGALARAGESAAFRRGATDVLIAGSALGCLPFAFLAGFGPDALLLLLGPGWEKSARLVPWFSACAAAAMVYSVALSVDTVRGSFRSMALAQAAATAATAGALWYAGTRLSLVLLSCAAGAGHLCGHAVQVLRWRARGVVEMRRLCSGYVVHGGLGVVLYAAGVGASQLAFGRPSAYTVMLLASVTLAAAACCRLRGMLPLYRVAAARGLMARRGSTDTGAPARGRTIEGARP